jgi:hypothetical protein
MSGSRWRSTSAQRLAEPRRSSRSTVLRRSSIARFGLGTRQSCSTATLASPAPSAPCCAEAGLVIGENEPYAVSDLTDYTVPVHGERRGLPHVEIEIRQDLIAEPAGQAIWAERLARLLPAAWDAFLRR